MIMPESSCTIYRVNNTGGFDRYYLARCHWQENKAKNVLKSGMQNADSITVYVPLNCVKITPNELLLPGRLLYPNSETLPANAAKDILVKGKCTFIFDNSNQQSISESLGTLQKNHECHTVMSIDNKPYGSMRLQHIKISAR